MGCSQRNEERRKKKYFLGSLISEVNSFVFKKSGVWVGGGIFLNEILVWLGKKSKRMYNLCTEPVGQVIVDTTEKKMKPV